MILRRCGCTAFATAFLFAIIGAASSSADAADVPDSDAASPPETALPPITEPPVDVPTHDPKPPRDTAAPPPPTAQSEPPPAHAAPAAPAAAKPAEPPPSPPASAPPASAPAAGATAQAESTITPADAPAGSCREAIYHVTIAGQPQLAYARVCRMPDGAWRLAP